MSEKTINTTSDEIKKSVYSIYSDLISKRREEKTRKAEAKRIEKEEKKASEEDNKEEKNEELTKKEKMEKKVEAWKEIIIGFTGDELEYVPSKKNKKKYKKWIDDTDEQNGIVTVKPKKKKKKNYTKEFESELNMLKSIVTDQNKFTTDLQKRFQSAAGPNTKDAMPLNKTLVELAAVVNNSRGNSLGLIKEIGNLKKTIADLWMKQKKLDHDTNGEGFNNQDVGLMGSNLASTIFGNGYSNINTMDTPVGLSDTISQPQVQQQSSTNMNQVQFKKFDPDSWDGGGLDSGNAKYEAIPHTVVVEFHKTDDKARFKAIRNDNGEELVGCPVPTCNIKAMDLKTNVAKDDFDQVYKVQVIEH